MPAPMLAHCLIVSLPALAPCTPELGAEQRYPAGPNDQQIAIADLNNDGAPDAVIGLFTNDQVNILYGDGLGGFFGVGVPVGSGRGGGVAVGDLNHDGLADIIAANVLDDDISIILAENDEGFLPHVRIPAGDGPASVAIADMNMDTHPDVAVSAGLDDTLRIFLGDGTGAFTPQAPLTIDDLRHVVVGYFNADAVPDLAVANSSPGEVNILIGAGDGTFAPPVAYTSVFGGGHVALGDLDANGTTDIVVVQRVVSVPPTDASVAVLLGVGDGTFGAPTLYTVGQQPNTCAIADFNNDGDLDVVCSNIMTSELSMLYGVGDGTLMPQIRMPFPDKPTAIAAADLAGDGVPDIVFLNNASDELSVLPNACAGGACNAADLAEPFGTLDFSDVIAFLTAFGTMDAPADLAEPIGTFDFSDVIAFLSAFGAGCP